MDGYYIGTTGFAMPRPCAAGVFPTERFTGLGFSLWLKDSDTDINAAEDLSYHNILAIKRRIEEKVTDLLALGMEMRTIQKSIGVNEKQYESVMKCFETIYKFEKAIDQL